MARTESAIANARGQWNYKMAYILIQDTKSYRPRYIYIINAELNTIDQRYFYYNLQKDVSIQLK